jgi:hypothetical protein
MFREIISNIAGIEFWPIIALLFFFAAFILVVIWAIRLDKSVVKRMKQLPLDSDKSLNNGDIHNG